jgi:hypothetical protein
MGTGRAIYPRDDGGSVDGSKRLWRCGDDAAPMGHKVESWPQSRGGEGGVKTLVGRAGGGWASIVHGVYPRDGGIWLAAKNDRGGEGGAAPTMRVVEGWSSHNDGFNFWRNPPDGCGVKGVGVSGSGGGSGFISLWEGVAESAREKYFSTIFYDTQFLQEVLAKCCKVLAKCSQSVRKVLAKCCKVLAKC